MVHARQSDEIGAGLLLQDIGQSRMLRSSAARGRAPGSLDLSRRKTVKICSAVIFLSALVSLSLTSEHLSAAEAELPGDYLPSYVSAAENGNAKSQYRLGLRFERGVGGALRLVGLLVELEPLGPHVVRIRGAPHGRHRAGLAEEAQEVRGPLQRLL